MKGQLAFLWWAGLVLTATSAIIGALIQKPPAPLGKVLLHAILGLALIYAGTWFVQMVRNSWQGDKIVIRPFQVIGSSTADAKLGESLASLLSAHFGRIQRQMQTAATTLDQAANTKSTRVAVEGHERLIAPFDLPNGVLRPMNLTMTVASVEVGSLVSWLHDRISQDSALTVTLCYTGQKPVATGIVPGKTGAPFWVEGEQNNETKLVSDLAYRIAQDRYAEDFPEVMALDTAEFIVLLEGLGDVAGLSLRAQVGGVNPKDYNLHFTRLEPLLGDLAEWRPFVHLMADLADRSGQNEKSLELYRQELALIPAGKEQEARSGILVRIDMLKSKVQVGKAAPVSAGMSQPHHLSQEVRDLLNLPGSPPETGTVTIGIVGPKPSIGGLTGENSKMVGSTSNKSEGFLDDYITNLVSTILLLAPDARFVFADVTTGNATFDEAEGFDALELLSQQSPTLDIIFFPYSSQRYLDLVRSDSPAHPYLLVLPAPPADKGIANGLPPDLPDGIAMAGAVDREGKPARFSSKHKDLLWAPGENVNGMSGTGPSAALLVGSAAILKSARPDLTPKEMVSLLRENSSAKEGSEVKLTDVAKALEKALGHK